MLSVRLEQKKKICRTVLPGSHYPYPGVWTFWGFNDENRMSTTATFMPNSANYTFTKENSGCSLNWNKLWGKGRCGFFNHHHQDSDRFVWRATTVPKVGNMIQIAAYAYDLGRIPYKAENTGVLLKEFRTLLNTSMEYTFRLELDTTCTRYMLYNGGAVIANQLLEELEVFHSNNCSNYNEGPLLNFYFGGSCAAPSNVTCCYRCPDNIPNCQLPPVFPTTAPSQSATFQFASSSNTLVLGNCAVCLRNQKWKIGLVSVLYIVASAITF